MNRMMISRFVVLAMLVVVLAVMGILPLPWEDPDFQVSGATVLVYMIWSLAGSGCACSVRSPARLCMYAVLLVSSVDSFLLRLTVVEGLLPLRWAGAALLAGGCVLDVLNRKPSGRYAPAMQFLGLAIGLGSIAGTACAALASLVVLWTPAGTGVGEDPE